MCSVISSIINVQPLALHIVYTKKNKKRFLHNFIILHMMITNFALLYQENASVSSWELTFFSTTCIQDLFLPMKMHKIGRSLNFSCNIE